MASIQFTGLASGLDTDSMVKAMLMGQQNRIDSAKNEKEMLKWKQEEWNKINDSINDFYTNYVDKLRKQATFYSYKTSISSNAVSASTSGSMTEGTHTFSKIELAESISKTGTLDSSIDSTTKSFKELNLLGEGMTQNIKLDTVDEDGNTITKQIEITADDTIASLEKKLEEVNSNLKLNFDLKNHKLFVASRDLGENSTIKMEFDDCDLFKMLGFNQLTDKDGSVSNGTSWDFKGKNASYTYNGVEGYTSETNDIEVNGVKVTLQEETTDEVVVNVKSDPDALTTFMKEFVDQYNKLLESLTKKYDATKVSTRALTDAEKQTMTDKQIDEYETAIKDSLLRRDESLNKVINTLRNSMQGIFSEGQYKSLSAVGIKTGSYSENGKLIFDEEGQKTFRKCVENNLEDVMKLFTATDDSEGNDDTLRDKKTGLGSKLYDGITSLRSRVEGLKSYKSYYNDKLTTDEIKSYASKMDELQEKYTRMEKLYKKKFTAMEKALSEINSQGATFANMLS